MSYSISNNRSSVSKASRKSGELARQQMVSKMARTSSMTTRRMIIRCTVSLLPKRLLSRYMSFVKVRTLKLLIRSNSV